VLRSRWLLCWRRNHFFNDLCDLFLDLHSWFRLSGRLFCCC
jgi:hypothetical protein